jgi:hypothetical protein
MERLLAPARDRTVQVNGWTLFDLLASEVHMQDVIVGGLCRLKCIGSERMGWEEHLAPSKPVSGVSDKVTYHPCPVVKVKILHVADMTVNRTEFLSVEPLDILKHKKLCRWPRRCLLANNDAPATREITLGARSAFAYGAFPYLRNQILP